MITTLFTGVLNDDTISIATDGKALLEVWTYATEWSDKLSKKLFPDIQSAIRYYQNKFPDRVFEQGKWWLQDNDIEEYPYTPEEYWKQVVYEMAYA